MKPAPFAYSAPESVAEAVELLSRFGDDGKVLAGGQSLIPVLAMRLSRFEHLVDLRRIAALMGSERTNGSVRISAMTTASSVEHDAALAQALPLLACAVPYIGHFPIRNRSTIGGSIAHADPAAELPAVALALDAELEVVGPRGTRRIAAADFFVGTWTTVLEPDELLVAAHFPVWSGRCGFAVHEVARRHGDYAMAGAAVGVELSGGRIARAAVALLSVASTPVRAPGLEQQLVGASVDALDVAELAHGAVQGLDPPDDLHASSAQRLRMAAAVIKRALEAALKEAAIEQPAIEQSTIEEARHG